MTSRLPDLKDLTMLLTVARTESMGQAADQSGVSQPAVSRQMAALERSLGVTLLQRSKRGTTLTPAGRVVVDWASTLLDAASDFSHSVQSLHERGGETLRVAVSMTIAEHVAPLWLARLQARSPDTAVSMLVGNSAEVVHLVESGGADVGFVESPRTTGPFRRRRVGGDRLVVAVAPDHVWAAGRRALTPGELAVDGVLVRESGSGTRETLEAALRGKGLELATGMVMGSNAALRSAAVAGMGAVVLSQLALEADLASSRLVEVPVDDLDLSRPFTALWRQDAEAHRVVVAILAAANREP